MNIIDNIYKAQYSNITAKSMPNLKTVFEKLYETKTKAGYHYVWYVFPYNVYSNQNQFRLKYPTDLIDFNKKPELVTNLIKASLLFLLISIEENTTLYEIFGSKDDIKFMNCLLLFYLFYYENNNNLYKLFEHFINIAYNNQPQRYYDKVFKIYLENESPINITFEYYIFNNIINTYDNNKMTKLYMNARNLIFKITNL